MENRPHDTSLSPSDNPDGVASEQTLATPHFDEVSIQNAQPAVPLGRIKGRRFWPLALILMGCSSLVGAVLGLALSRYENRSPAASAPEERTESVAQDGSGVSTRTRLILWADRPDDRLLRKLRQQKARGSHQLSRASVNNPGGSKAGVGRQGSGAR